MIYSLETLRRAYQAGERPKYLFFWGHTPAAPGRVDASCLSQWFPCRFRVEQIDYACAEQFMMAEKARLFADDSTRARILEARHPKQMKELGRAVRGFEQARWDEHCYRLVLEGNCAKFSQNPVLWDYLKRTNGRVLVEASPVDRIWGIGLSKQDPDAENPMKWRGANLLGFALTEARDRLLSEEKPL